MNTAFKIETFERKDWLGRLRLYWRLKVKRNGEIVAASEAYNTRRDRNLTAELLRDNLAEAEIVPVQR
jgi:uncharacterized protein YegP (UPF0339 family)